jgi:purine-binding chemotaxis protein CheW
MSEQMSEQLIRTSNKEQYTTFSIEGRLYGIDVMKVQEVTRPLPMTEVPMAPDYVCGLINLRGQIATAISLRRLFGITGERPKDEMNVVCRIDGLLFSFLVDWIGDVTEVEQEAREPAPATISTDVKRFIDGICRLPSGLLSIINIDRISETINSTELKDRQGN